jgi:hypothetical protein
MSANFHRATDDVEIDVAKMTDKHCRKPLEFQEYGMRELPIVR